MTTGASNKRGRTQYHCSFCGKNQDQVNRLIAGPGSVYICNECVRLCQDIITEEENPVAETLNETGTNAEFSWTPEQIVSILDDFIVGQEQTKKVLAVAVYNHYKRVDAKWDSDIELDKSNILLIGGTGTGKTEFARTLARILEVPFSIADATALTEAGYVGEDVENILLRLLEAADFDMQRAERGIIYIDEIDKVSRKTDNPSITRDVSGEGVQQALLKIIEGVVASVPPQGGRKHPHQEFLQFDTSNVLFICGGAFEGLEDVIGRRRGITNRPLGFDTVNSSEVSKEIEKAEILKHVTHDDLLQYGLIPEFVGRLPVISTLTPLDLEMMTNILTQPKNAVLKQFQHMFKIDGVELQITAEALTAVAKKALGQRTGARGLRTVLEQILMETMFEIPSRTDIKTCVITSETVEDSQRPLLMTASDAGAFEESKSA